MGIFNFLKKAIVGEGSQHNTVSYTKSLPNESISYSIDPILLKKFPNGLLPGELVLINWIEGKTINAKYPRYFETTYGIEAKQSLEKLQNEGYIKEASPIESLTALKLPELKGILKTKELKLSGKKADLISRIGENYSSDEIESFIENRMIRVTDKGKKVLEEYYYIVPAHRYDSKDGVYNVANAIRHVSKLNYKPGNGDISWALFQRSYMEHAVKFQYGLMTIDIRNMAEQLRREKRYKDALFHYLRVFIMGTSGLGNSNHLSHPNYMMYDIPSRHIIEQLIETLNLDESALKVEFINVWDKTELKYHYLTLDECFQCLLYSFDDNSDEVKEALFNAYNRLNKEMDEKSFWDKYGLEFPNDYEVKYEVNHEKIN
ncbi:SAP domain-containing protein [Bacillus haynesii]|uniref:SAP domain-containing protein n=2 Tax=Bacillus haynesii TaxID=1925021 RepID=UPI00227FA9AF|nr:SAP domain-containing protein [Bacillus haynesii]MCY8436307.1 SAP domain-containing protein [Bacillus haynesii]MCY9158586.1 SAP domain-containing protein [Bacillus haynesii]